MRFYRYALNNEANQKCINKYLLRATTEPIFTPGALGMSLAVALLFALAAVGCDGSLALGER